MKEVATYDLTLTSPSLSRGQSIAADRLAQEMVASWRRGERVQVEHFLDRQPDLRNKYDVLLRLLYEELSLRQQAGETIDLAAFAERFPEYQREVKALLYTSGMVSETLNATPADFPALRGFQVLGVLGAGVQGQVYLATQPQLGDRPVVIKISSSCSREHISLGRLLHTNIVPLFWAYDEPDNDRRILCMPYFGSVTLERLLDGLQATGVKGRSGQQILDVLDAPTVGLKIPLLPGTPARKQLERLSYERAICWMGERLADALHYAHERGLVHLDLKPSNVLIAGDGQPMLLDFHLAREPISPDGPVPRGFGGTPLYMSPEQKAVMQAVMNRQPIPVAVDRRSDIFSLGLMLYEAFGGKVNGAATEFPRLETVTRGMSPGLSDIIHKCLAPVAENRYADARALAVDLGCQWRHKPLRGVPNRPTERWRK